MRSTDQYGHVRPTPFGVLLSVTVGLTAGFAITGAPLPTFKLIVLAALWSLCGVLVLGWAQRRWAPAGLRGLRRR